MDGYDFTRFENFVEFQLWPRTGISDSRRWLDNFRGSEVALAQRLMEGVVRYSTELSKEMFVSAFLEISQHVIVNKGDLVAARSEWREFCDSVVLVRVEGDSRSEASSGHIFARMARDILKIDDTRILSPQEIVKHLAMGQTPDIVFIDDFVGSGDQFVADWNKSFDFGIEFSLRTVVGRASYPGKIFYTNLVCTDFGAGLIQRVAPKVQITSAHRISDKYSALSSKSFIWRDDMATEGPEFVRSKSLELGIPDLNGSKGCLQGYCKLGLAIAFDHGIPDATLPLLTFRREDWNPLIQAGI